MLLVHREQQVCKELKEQPVSKVLKARSALKVYLVHKVM